MTAAETAKRMIQVVGVSALVMMIAGAAFYRSLEAFSFALGVCMTAGVNILRIYMLQTAVENALNMDTGKAAGRYIRGQFLIRFALMAVVLTLAATVDFINLWGAVAGIFTMQISGFSMKFFTKDDAPAAPVPAPDAEVIDVSADNS